MFYDLTIKDKMGRLHSKESRRKEKKGHLKPIRKKKAAQVFLLDAIINYHSLGAYPWEFLRSGFVFLPLSTQIRAKPAPTKPRAPLKLANIPAPNLNARKLPRRFFHAGKFQREPLGGALFFDIPWSKEVKGFFER